jgi:hypothetical protein
MDELRSCHYNVITPTLDVAIAEREAYIQPNGVPDDRGRKLMVGKRDRHPHLSRQPDARCRCRDKAPGADHTIMD